MSKPPSTAKITLATPSWHQLDDGRKAKISAGMRKPTTQKAKMGKQPKRRKLERDGRKSRGSRRLRRMH